MLKINSAALSDRGMIRENNEDSFLIGAKNRFFIVADGVGGNVAGEIASRMTVQFIADRLEKNKDLSEVEKLIENTLFSANEAVHEASLMNEELKGMATTVVLAVFRENSLYIAHVGDSRAYLIRGGDIIPLTEDHSLVAEQLKKGQITEQEARKSQNRNVITQAIGLGEKIRPGIGRLEALSGDKLLLCTDGLSDLLMDEEIKTIITEEKLDEAVKKLINAANSAGGGDNITVLLAAFSI